MDFQDVNKKTWIVKDMVFIKPLRTLRQTPSVKFYNIVGVTSNLSAIDKVVHAKGAISPRIQGAKKSEKFWYMHTAQEDNLVVHKGKRIIYLYEKKHGKVEKFEATATYIKRNDKIIYKGPAVLGWPTKVFHRIRSPQGSMSTNYAKHFKGFSIHTNFNIYRLNTKTGEYEVAREGHKDQ